jgi:hypothetical protein
MTGNITFLYHHLRCRINRRRKKKKKEEEEEKEKEKRKRRKTNRRKDAEEEEGVEELEQAGTHPSFSKSSTKYIHSDWQFSGCVSIT